MRKSILIVSPHADDETLSCGGLILKNVRQGNDVKVVVFGVGGLKHRHVDNQTNTDERIKEFNEAMDLLEVTDHEVLFPGKDMKMDTFPMVELVTVIDDIVDKGQFDEIYIPHPSHNNDHLLIFRASWASLRRKAHVKPPSIVATYEYVFMGFDYEPAPGGRMYVDITPFIEMKIEAFMSYKSQIRPFPSPISPEGIRNLARTRGYECGCDFAEMYYLHRMIV